MKRLARLAARLYPRAWNSRYAEEFDALLEDMDRGWRDVADITAGAITMQLRVRGLAVIGWTALGALAGAVISLQMMPRYDSSGVVRLRLADAQSSAISVPRDVEPVFASAFTDTSIEQIGRWEGLISPGESARSTSDVIGRIRSSTLVNIASVDDGAAGRRVAIGFRDTDGARSQRISRKLLQLVVEANFARRSSVNVQILSPSAAPTLSFRFDQLGVTLAAAALGTLIGVVVLFIRRPSPCV